MNDTILHYAAYKANRVLVEYLLEKGANVNLTNTVKTWNFLNFFYFGPTSENWPQLTCASQRTSGICYCKGRTIKHKTTLIILFETKFNLQIGRKTKNSSLEYIENLWIVCIIRKTKLSDFLKHEQYFVVSLSNNKIWCCFFN